MSQKKPSLVARFLFFINNLVVLITWVAYVAWFINPSIFPYFGVLALFVPALVVLNIFFFFFWLFVFRKYALLSLITIGLGYWHINGLVNFSNQTATKTEDTFRVMSFNTKYYFAGFTWAKTYAPKEEVQAFVEEVDPDIFCMQEFQNAKPWVPRHKLKYRFLSKHETSHLAIFSVYPFIETGEVEYPNKNKQYDKFIFADVVRQADTMRIVVAHLASFGLEPEDLKNIKHFDELPEKQISTSSKTILKRLKSAYKKHGVQAQTIVEFINKSPYPVIFCGDLNDTPTSYAYRKLTRKLNDSFKQAGSGFGSSQVRFKKNGLPLRIDHILVEPVFEAQSWNIYPAVFSDHFPIYTDLKIAL